MSSLTLILSVALIAVVVVAFIMLAVANYLTTGSIWGR